MNKGLSDYFKLPFPGITTVLRPELENLEIKNPNWVIGFIEAEGCFHIGISKQNKVQLRFAISQYNRDEALIRSLVD